MSELRAQIVSAFPELPIPTPQTAVEDTYCVEHLHEHLAGRPWTEPTVGDYRQCEDGFSLLTVAGLHYYLPGYLCSELDDPETADVIAEHVCSTLGGKSAFCRERMKALGAIVTPLQMSALKKWLHYYVAEYGANGSTRRALATIDNWG